VIYFPSHNISPPLDEQLVLELKRRKEGAKLLNGLPRSFSIWKTVPLNQDVPNTATKLTPDGTGRAMKNPAVPKWRKRRCRLWWCAMEGLEHTHMEHIMDARVLRKTKTIGHLSNTFCDLVWTSEAGGELAPKPRRQRLGWTMKDPQEDPVAHSKLQGPMASVIGLLSICLSPQQTIPYLCKEVVTVTK